MKKLRRVTAASLAALLVASNVVTVFAAATKAATPRTTTSDIDVVLSYLHSDENDPTVASILVGNSTTMRIDKPSGLTKADPPFIVTPADSTIKDPNNWVKINDNLNKTTADVTVVKGCPMPASGDNWGMATFSIQGSYYALQPEGDIYEKDAAGGEMLGKVKYVDTASKKAIMTYSEVTIICEVAEGINADGKYQPPKFKIKDGSDTSGLFLDYVGGTITLATEGTDPASDTNNGDKSVPKSRKLAVQFAKGGTTNLFTWSTNTRSTVEVETGELDANNKPIKVKTQNNYIAKDTEFRLVFRMPRSSVLFLNALTPQRAVSNIAGEIARNDGQVTNSYIELAEDDSLNFITENFRLNSRAEQYSTIFDVDWFWYSEEAEKASQVTEGLIGDKGGMSVPDGWLNITKDNKVDVGNDPHKDVLTISNSGEWRGVELHPEVNDVKGFLVARVYYKKNNSSEEISYVSKPISVLVRGRGNPASVKQYSQTIGASSEQIFTTDAEKKLPTTKTMDIYDGSVPNFPQPKDPYRYRLELNMGKLNASSQYAIVTATKGDGSVVALQQVYNGVPETYELGAQIENPMRINTDQEATVYLDLTAQKKGTVTLQVIFYVKGNNDKIVEAAVQPKPIEIVVTDTSPNDDAALATLVLKDQNKQNIPFGFDPEVLDYTISVPYSTEKVTVTPTRRDSLAAKHMVLEVQDDGNQQVYINEQHENGYISPQFDLEPNVVTNVFITETAQNPNIKRTYHLRIVREPPSDDSSLKILQFYNTLGEELLKNFDPKTMVYNISVPYRTKIVRVEAVPNHPGAHAPSFEPALTTQTESGFGAKEWLPLIYENGVGGGTFQNKTTLGISILPENNVVYDSSTYKVTFTRLDPSKIATLADLKVTDAQDKAITYKPAFNTATDTYEVEVPFATSKLKIQGRPTDENASLALYDGETLIQELKNDVPSKAFDIPFRVEGTPPHTYTLRVTAEDELTTMDYYIQVSRAEPSNDATLKDLKTFDQDGNPVRTWAFNTEVREYEIHVDYEVKQIAVQPTSNYSVESITVGGKRVQSGNTSSLINLDYPKNTLIEVVVTAEDSKTKEIYKLNFFRDAPSSDARLRGLVVSDTTDFQPTFIASKNSYTANVAKDATTVTVTPTANHKFATIKVDGVQVNSGEASEPIVLLEVKQDIKVEVLAQDGQTTNTYTVHLTNLNLVPKTNNADLANLQVLRGVMTPRFAASTTEYEVSTTEETYSVQIVPDTVDPYAKVQVFAGTKEIGDKRGNFSQAIQDGENNFTVKVTSSDETTTKEYDITVYRNEEEQMKTLAPLTTEDLDIEHSPNPILVDVSKYPRISAGIFNELKKYPEKTIIFQGNDYSVRFDAKNLTRVIPSTEIYDFRMSFDSPEEEEIMDIVGERSANDDIYDRGITLLYFEHHGELPGPAVLNLSLGDRYADRDLYWHYYNAERERIDYYGRVHANNRGTFAVQIDHFSTYIVSRRHRIAGSEKMYAGTDVSEYIGLNGSGVKLNPNTGGPEEPECEQ